MSSDCGYQGNGPCPLCEDAEPLPEVSDFWKWVQSDSCIPYQDDVTVEDEIQVRDLYHLQQRLYSEVKSLRTANVRLQSLADEAIKERDKAVERELAWTARAEAAEGNTVNVRMQELVAEITEENVALRVTLQGYEDYVDQLEHCFEQIDTARADLQTHQEYLDDADVEDDDQ